MPTLSRIIISWAGSPVVGPGATVCHAQQGDEGTALDALHTYFSAIFNNMPAGLQWTFPTSGDTIDEVSGQVVGAWSSSVRTPVSCLGSGTWTNGVGLRVVLPTIGVVNGHRVTGSMFMVPLLVSAYEGAGNITSATLGIFQPAATTLATTPNALRIYSRPRPGHGGISFPTLSATVPDKVSWLRSRRT